MSQLLEIGRVVRAHGLRGQVVVELWTNRLERVAPGSKLVGPAGELTVTGSSPTAPAGGHQRKVVAFAEIQTREAAEGLRDAPLRAEPIADDTALWVHDLVGSKVYTVAGDLVGEVDSVEANPASDLLVLADGKLIPLSFVTAAGAGTVTVDVPEGLFDL